MVHFQEEYQKALDHLSIWGILISPPITTEQGRVISPSILTSPNEIKYPYIPQPYRYLVHSSNDYDMALECFGRALHPLQDVFAHEDWKPLKVEDELYIDFHKAYLQPFYPDGREQEGVLYNQNTSFRLIDSIEYDITVEERQIIYPDVLMDFSLKQEIYVVRYVHRDGGTRYNKTEYATKRWMKEFYNKLQEALEKAA